MSFLMDYVVDPAGAFTEGGGGIDSSINPMSDSPGAKKGDPLPNESAIELSRIARELFQQSDPLRRSLIGRSEGFINGGMDVTKSPMYGALKAGNDSAFNKAKDNIIGKVAPGGSLVDALTDLEGTRAVNMAQGVGGLAQDELSRAITLATGQVPAAVSGLGGAANIQAQALAAQQAADGQAKQGAGAGIGTIIAAMFA